MANIGPNTNHAAGTGRSYNTPEKHFGKEVGIGKYQASPEFAETLDVGATVEGTEAASADVGALGAADSERFEGELGRLAEKRGATGASAFDADVALERVKELAASAGEYVKRHPKLVASAAVALGALGVGMLMRMRGRR